ncbi:MAG: protein kinase [Myxococcota bacterium]
MQLPATFGKYELLERLATGGMAEVYLARSFGVAGFEKRLVIKRIRPELARDPHHVSLFINEAKIGVHLNHENVVQVYDLGRVGRDWFMAMEHLHGRDLNKLVKVLRAEGRLLPRPIAVHAVAEVCRGLAYAHALVDAHGSPLGLVHRDVSPHNVLLTFNGAVKLVDFGIARLVGTGSVPKAVVDPAGTEPTNATPSAPRKPGGGKYAYMSPEQARGQEVDHRTDVFSAGIVLWELLVGHRLFDDPDPAEKLAKVQECRIPSFESEGIEVDPELSRIVLKALAADRDDRYPSAGFLEEDLRAWLFQHQAGDLRGELIALLNEGFPDDAATRRRAPGLERMLADVDRLGGDAQSTSTPAQTPSQGALPDKLRPADGERKRVVALVIDVDGMTDLSLRLDPEALFKRHYQLLRWLRRSVDNYDGLVQRVVDDQILVLFGVPRTRVDDLSRALECSLELVRTSVELQRHGLRVQLAIGAHVGDVTVVLGKRQAKYTARGNTTRLARRLSAIADHGDILVSQALVDGTEGLFRYRSGPSIINRGGRAPGTSFRLEGRRRGLRTAGKGPWLRRGKEIEVIRAALGRLAQGKGGVIGLAGAVGSGKSRLAREVRDLALRRGVPVYLGRARAWRDDKPLALFADLILDVLGIESDTPRARITEELERLPQLGLSPREVQGIAALLGVNQTEGPGQDEVWRALERTLKGLAQNEQSIVILEDVHHLADKGQNSLISLLRRLSAASILVLLTYTGTLPPELAKLGEAVELGRFSSQTLRRLLRELLEVEDVDEGLVELVARTCEGNPLYVEEMVKYLLANGRVQVDEARATLVAAPNASDIPDSLAGLIAARIDALEPAGKGALQLAATLGQTFTLPLLSLAMGIGDPTPVVSELSAHGLIQRVEVSHVDAWTFVSNLVREVTLRSILGVQRRIYHRLVAEALEAHHEDDLEPHATKIAAHCAAAGRHVDAARYLFMAGQRLNKGQFLEEARTTFERGLKYIQEVPETPETWDARVQGEAMLSYRSGALSRLLGEEQRAERSLQTALDISSDSGLPWIEVRAHLELGRLYLTRGHIPLAEAHTGQARSLARIEADPELQMETLEASANLAYEQGKNEESEALWREALEHAGDDTSAHARCHLGMASRCIRDNELQPAAELLEKALGSARQSRDRILIGRVLNNMGLLHYWSGRFDEALAAFRDALQVREGIGYSAGVVVNHHNIGDVHFSRGDLPRAWVAFSRSKELAETMGWARGVVLNDVYLGAIAAMRGEVEVGLAQVLAARQHAVELGDAEIAANAALLGGRILMGEHRLNEAKNLLDEAHTQAQTFGLRTMVASLDELRTGLIED